MRTHAQYIHGRPIDPVDEAHFAFDLGAAGARHVLGDGVAGYITRIQEMIRSSFEHFPLLKGHLRACTND